MKDNWGLALLIGLGAIVGAAAVFLIAKVAQAAPSNGFIIRLVNAPEGSDRWICNLTTEGFNFDPVASSGTLAVNEEWVYQGLYKGEPAWQVVSNVVVTIVDANDNLVGQFEVFSATIENGKIYNYDCEVPDLVEV